MAEHNGKAIVVGGGPVGTLTAVFLGRRGFHVDLYEARSDIRSAENVSGRSINLALSVRGLSALKHGGIEERIRSIGIPMHSRYIHTGKGSYTIPYGKKGQYLLSTDRLELNRQLLSVAEKSENVNLYFEHKLVNCDTRIPSATFQKAGSEITKTGDVLIGCDGAYSAVRRQMLKGRMDFSQFYIEHGYKELCIPPTADGEYAMPPNHLHIWPRHEYMLIALPNLDKSFTCTLFMPFSKYEQIVTGNDVIDFFNVNFNDVVPLIGDSLLRTSFFELPPLPVVTVKCSPFHHGKTALLLGDAAHAVVPFYGQGLNAGLEDALIFDGLVDKFGCDFEQIVPKFSEVRVKAAHAIADLSLYNYMEMRSHVATPWFLLRKKVDGFLNILFPSSFIPRYSMVTFTRIPYDQALKRAKVQDKIVDNGIIIAGGLMLTAIAFAAYKTDWKSFDLSNLTLDRVIEKAKHLW
uniref:kynurenine 3-monooxygenase-like n=1 Tax=Styela clava TaxID=7725 RepID=UPI00193AA20D|nr:kynurenine 3-monooxygenase-like [Styela clava]